MRTVLVVDDSLVVRTFAKQTLESAGFRVQSAQDGEEGLRSLAANPDVVLIDLFMPDKDGIEMFREMRSDYPNYPIIAMFTDNLTLEMARSLAAR